MNRLFDFQISLPLAIAIASCTAVPASAAFSIVDLRSNVGVAGSANQVIGWEFTPTTAIAVTKLGFYDSSQDGLAVSHDVGIFDVATELLVVAGTVDSGSTSPIEGPPVRLSAGIGEIGAFRYTAVTSQVLLPGHNYAIAGTNAGYADSTALYGLSPDYFLETAQEISYVQGRYIFSSPPNLAFPVDAFGASEFGPAFQFTVVPEPATQVLMLIGVVVAVTSLRRSSALVADHS